MTNFDLMKMMETSNESIVERAGVLRRRHAEAGVGASDLAVPQEKVFVNVEEYGNMASACLPIGLDEARSSGMVKDGSLVLLVAFRPGFVWGSALVQM